MSVEQIRLETADLAVFAAEVDSRFAVATEENEKPRFELVLKEVQELRGVRPSGTKPFALYFRSQDDLPVQQQIFWLQHERLGELVLFLVPVEGNQEARIFQAVIN